MINKKSIFRVAGAACAATGVVALSGLVASGAAVGAVVAGFKAAAETMKKLLADDSQAENLQAENDSAKADDPAAEDAGAETGTANQESLASEE